MNSIILLDIDGAIAPIYSLDNDDYVEIATDYTSWQIPFVNIYNIERIIKTDKIVWSSAWEEQSNLINRLLEIPDFEYIEFLENYDEWFKERAIEKFIEQRKIASKIVWIDDEIPERIIEKYTDEENILVIVPDGKIGITFEEWKTINDFLE